METFEKRKVFCERKPNFFFNGKFYSFKFMIVIVVFKEFSI